MKLSQAVRQLCRALSTYIDLTFICYLHSRPEAKNTTVASGKKSSRSSVVRICQGELLFSVVDDRWELWHSTTRHISTTNIAGMRRRILTSVKSIMRNFSHDSGLLEDSNVGAIISHHHLRVDDEEKGSDNSREHDDDEDNVDGI